jgi:hypothetical protein
MRKFQSGIYKKKPRYHRRRVAKPRPVFWSDAVSLEHWTIALSAIIAGGLFLAFYDQNYAIYYTVFVLLISLDIDWSYLLGSFIP